MKKSWLLMAPDSSFVLLKYQKNLDRENAKRYRWRNDAHSHRSGRVGACGGCNYRDLALDIKMI